MKLPGNKESAHLHWCGHAAALPSAGAMKSSVCTALLPLLVFVFAGNASAGFDTAPLSRISTLEERTTGVVRKTDLSGKNYRGSGVIARDTRLFYSCAHVFYDAKNEYATHWYPSGTSSLDFWTLPANMFFYPGYHRVASPETVTNGQSPETYFKHATYGESVRQKGIESGKAFSLDFIIAASYLPFGNEAAAWWPGNATNVLKGSNSKFIGGYPALYDVNGLDSGGFFQHATPRFNTAATDVEGRYLHIYGVTTGGGNSGGPVWVKGSDDRWGLAGILVSGPTKPVTQGGEALAGINAMDSFTEAAGQSLLNTNSAPPPSNQSSFASTDTPQAIPDNNATGIASTINVTSSGNITSLTATVRIAHAWKGDLVVTLISPAGVGYVLHNRTGGSDKDVVLLNLPVTVFNGAIAAGQWKLRVQDLDAAMTGTLNAWSLTVTTSPATSGPVSLFPQTPIAGQPVTITYNPAGRNLASATSVNIHYGYNGGNWTRVPGVPMTKIDSGWAYTYTVPTNASSIVMCFNQSNITWDNNGRADWTFSVAKPSSNGFTFAATDVPKAIPDNNSSGIASAIDVAATGNVASLTATVKIRHSCRGDLRVSLISPSGKQRVLQEVTYQKGTDLLLLDVPVSDFNGAQAAGQWKLLVQDLDRKDVGTLDAWSLNIKTEQPPPSPTPPPASGLTFAATDIPKDIPDNKLGGIFSTIDVPSTGRISSLAVSVKVTHAYRGDLSINLFSPSGKFHSLLPFRSGGSGKDFVLLNLPVTSFNGTTAAGKWYLFVSDLAKGSTGTLSAWSLTIATTQ